LRPPIETTANSRHSELSGPIGLAAEIGKLDDFSLTLLPAVGRLSRLAGA